MDNEVTFNKNVSNYSDDVNNYKIDGELTVTITLNEYRDLVAFRANGKAQIEKANSDWCEERSKKEKLQAELAEANKKLAKYICSETKELESEED